MNAPDKFRNDGSAALLERFRAVRAETMQRVAPLSAEDCCVQAMADASPAKWHLAHTTWFYETFILEGFESAFRPHHPAFRMLFNSYYNGVGEKHARVHRGVLTRPSHAEVLAYRADVDERIAALLLQARPGDARAVTLARLIGLGLQHEQQHQELIMTDLKYLLSMNPLLPAYNGPVASQARSPSPSWSNPLAPSSSDTRVPPGATAATAPSGSPAPTVPPEPSRAEPDVAPTAPAWLDVDGGVVAIGHDGAGFCFDNEMPRHRSFVEPYALATRLVSNREFRRFVEQGGYGNAAYWLSEGWDWVCANGLQHPLYWHRDAAGGWREFGLHGAVPLDEQAAVLHLSYYEADAYARWAGARLPTEAEWEAAAHHAALQQLYDTGWQWTSSSYAPYPGYAPPDGALGEYNGKFMVNQYVLRGGSCVTPAGHSRATYRNFFPASARWQFSGIRLAKSRPSGV